MCCNAGKQHFKAAKHAVLPNLPHGLLNDLPCGMGRQEPDRHDRVRTQMPWRRGCKLPGVHCIIIAGK